MGKRKPNLCKCGKEIPIGRRGSPYCSEACREKYGKLQEWRKETDPTTKAKLAKIRLVWARERTMDELIDWYQRGEVLQIWR